MERQRSRRRSPIAAAKEDYENAEKLLKEEEEQLATIQLLKDLYAIHRHREHYIHPSQRQKQDDDDNSSTISFVKAMNEMANTLDSVNFNISNNNDTNANYEKREHLRHQNDSNNDDCTDFVTLEKHSFYLRSTANHYISILLPTLQSKALSLYTKLLTNISASSQSNFNSKLKCIGKAIYTELQAQLYWEESIATRVILYLEELYTTLNNNMHQGDDKNVVEQFQHQFSRWLKLHSSLLLQHNSFCDIMKWPNVLEHIEYHSKDEETHQHLQQGTFDSSCDENHPSFVDKDNDATFDKIDVTTARHEEKEEDKNTKTSPSSSSSSSSLSRRVNSTSNIWEVIQIFLSHPIKNHTEPIISQKNKKEQQESLQVSSVLLVGPSGCGKTHLCDSIQQYLSFSSNNTQARRTKVIRPKLPTNLMLDTVGSSEDIIISMFAYAKYHVMHQNNYQNCVILLDGIEHLFGSSFSNSGSSSDGSSSNATTAAVASAEESHLLLRIRSTFLTAFDSLKKDYNNNNNNHPRGGGNMLIIGTARNVGNSVSDRFDQIIHMGSLSSSSSSSIREVECSNMISSCLQQPETQVKEEKKVESVNNNYYHQSDTKIQELLSTIVKCAAGKTAAEISRSCRDALISIQPNNDDEKSTFSSTLYEKRLQHLKSSLQTIVPTSIKSGGSLDDGILDVTIYTSKKLCSKLEYDETTKKPVLPLFGSNANKAWKQIETLIVTPLCHSNELEDILYGGDDDNCDLLDGDDTFQQQRGGGGGSGGKIVCAGTLLTGPPGSGKTVLAKHCAAVAASIVPSIRLLDVSCTSLIHKEVGGSERAVQKLFAAARAASPCIILLDGIEHVAPLRGHDNTTEGTMDRLLSTVLTEMDGIDERSSSSGGDEAAGGKVAVIGITHNPKWIDPALRRPGRLEKCIILDRPDVTTRKEIIRREIEKLPIDLSKSSFFEPKDKDSLAEYVALQTHGMSASEIIAVCTEACMICIREIAFQNNDDDDNHGGNAAGLHMEPKAELGICLASR